MADLLDARAKLISELAMMPAEAFSWIVNSLLPPGQRLRNWPPIFPDGLGGFMPETRTSIQRTQAAAVTYAATAVKAPSDGR